MQSDSIIVLYFELLKIILTGGMIMSKINLKKYSIEAVSKYDERRSNMGRISVSITYSNNGMRMTLSKELCSMLEVEDSVYIGISIKEGCIIISTEKLANMEKFKMSSDGRTIYSSSLIRGIVNAFELDEYYEEHSSRSFYDIDLDEEACIAVVQIEDDEMEDDDE